MSKVAWLLVLVIPPWIAAELDAPKWVLRLAAAPFFLFAMSLDDPDENLVGEGFQKFRKGTLVLLLAGGLALGTVVFLLWQAFFSGTQATNP